MVCPLLDSAIHCITLLIARMRPSLTASRLIGATSLAIALPGVFALSPRTQIADSYDFVVVGGGQAGLVLGARLSEDANHTVLVLEAGGNGDDYRERIGGTLPALLADVIDIYWANAADIALDTPAYGYFQSLWTTPLNWAFYTTPQPNVNDREIYWPRGKVLGGL